MMPGHSHTDTAPWTAPAQEEWFILFIFLPNMLLSQLLQEEPLTKPLCQGACTVSFPETLILVFFSSAASLSR